MLWAMSATPAFLDSNRPDVPDIVVPRGVTPFHLPGRPVRGRLVRLGPLADALLTRHDNHPAVTALGRRGAGAGGGAATALKFRGSFSLQAKGDGAVPMLLADCTEAGALRGYARAEPERLATLLAAEPDPSAPALLGNGYLAFTVDQGDDTERHQGIVAIEGESLADMALHYFETSEQIRCSVRLACAQTDAGWRAGGADPGAGRRRGRHRPGRSTTAAQDESLAHRHRPGRHAERRTSCWTTRCRPTSCCTACSALEGVAADRHRALAYGCRCSRARLSGILEGFSTDDLDHMAVDGDIVMTCEFCNLDFRFGRDEVRGQADSRPEADPMAISRRLALLAPAWLAAAGLPHAPTTGGATFPPLRYDYLTRLRAERRVDRLADLPPPGPLDALVAGPAGAGAAADGRGPAGGRRLERAGRWSTIEEARIVRVGDGLDGAMAIHLDVIAADGARAGFAEARVARRASGIGRDLRGALYDITKQMLDDMNVELEFQLRRSLRDYLQTAGAAPAPPPVQREDLPVPAPAPRAPAR